MHRFEKPEISSERSHCGSIVGRIRRDLIHRSRAPENWIFSVFIGVCAASIAVAVRQILPLLPGQLPTLSVIVAVAFVTTLVGRIAGVVTAVLGVIPSWYLFGVPQIAGSAGNGWIPLVGFVVLTAVIIVTAELYRRNLQLDHDLELRRLRAEAEVLETFAAELAHRLKNSFAIIQSIAVQTMGNDDDRSAKFSKRLQALAVANDLLCSHIEDPVATVEDVIDAALRPFEARDRIQLGKVDQGLHLSSQGVTSLSLLFHELGTNAVKYGALSVPTGHITIDTFLHGDEMRFEWAERGGPEIRAPGHQGFGTKLLNRLSSSFSADYQMDGLRCSFSIPVRKSMAR